MNFSLQNWAFESLKERFSNNSQFGQIHSGLIATGDKFVDNKMELQKICNNFPELKAVEMEGGAVSQVAFIESIPLLVIRVISDNADHSAGSSFEKFIVEYNSVSWNLISSLLINLNFLDLESL